MEKRKKTKELPEDLRNQIVRKHEQSQGYKSISKDLNVPVSTVRSVIKKFRPHGTMANLPRCGRKRKIDKRFQRKIVQMLDKEPRLISKQVQAALQSEGTTVSTRTIRRHLNGLGAYKTIEEDDMKFPLIYGEGKKARVMATIGVTRGFGDHDLKVYNSNIYIKPFLSCIPGVKVYDLAGCDHNADDVMVMGTDGLWDVITDREVADIVQRVFAAHGTDQPNRYNLAAQELVLRTRGVRKENSWRLPNGKLASLDDISVFVIPLAGHDRCEKA
ncbi:unnamed protein product [Ranitomeya imitator]|uniref:PPM-type phosphatase domain-containing protein n=1 Tax=Ranitomeya imitator TaxID=111125 RepID=A0ABN9KZD1_9NEOB|nr:unnamed protein product [Ranitomeya imitator]